MKRRHTFKTLAAGSLAVLTGKAVCGGTVASAAPDPCNLTNREIPEGWEVVRDYVPIRGRFVYAKDGSCTCFSRDHPHTLEYLSSPVELDLAMPKEMAKIYREEGSYAASIFAEENGYPRGEYMILVARKRTDGERLLSFTKHECNV